MVRRNSQELVIHAARDLLVEGHEVSIAEVVERSGVSVGSVYHHFKSKQGILQAAEAEAFGHYLAGLRSSLLTALSRKKDGALRRGKRGRRLFVQTAISFHTTYAHDEPHRMFVIRRGALKTSLNDKLADLLPRDVRSAPAFCALLFGGLFFLDEPIDQATLEGLEARMVEVDAPLGSPPPAGG